MGISLTAIVLFWGLFAGLVFSSVGAAGGILVSFGLISIVGVADPNNVKPMAQAVVLAAALVFVPVYFRRSAFVWPLGLLLAGGGLLGAWFGSTVSSLYLADMKTFRPLFGVLTLVVGAQIAWRLFRSRGDRDARTHSKRRAYRRGVRELSLSLTALSFSYGGRDYRVSTLSPVVAGFLIATIAAILGVGGGFLLVPFMTSILHMPMHIVPATSGIAIIISLLVSIGNYVALGAHFETTAIVPLLAGAILGAIIGPFVNRWMKNSWLLAVLSVIIVAIGLRYVLS